MTYRADPVQPRPNPVLDAVPTPRPTPYIRTGLGWKDFEELGVNEHLLHLCPVQPRRTGPPRTRWHSDRLPGTNSVTTLRPGSSKRPSCSLGTLGERRPVMSSG
jgi:hypothetical protein